MKLFVSKTKDWAQKAAELKAALEKVPPTVAEIRQSVTQTTDQLRQLRSEVRGSVAELKADNDVQLSEALQEIKSSMAVFLEAGYEVGGLDIEMSPSQRLVARLTRLKVVGSSTMKSLIAANQHQPAVHAILNALLQANQLAEEVDLTGLEFRDVLVTVGPMPSVRACWKSDDVFQADMPAYVGAPVQSPSSVPPPTPPVSLGSSFGSGSFFEARTQAARVKTTESPSTDEPVHPSATMSHETVPVAESHAATWTGGALERFKKDPRYSKYRR
jgi:arsenate reductase-like glutaredoxin family protein